MIVLDTHALIWWVSDRRKLSQHARREIARHADEEAGLRVSSISTWEISMLVKKGRLALTVDIADWMSHVEQVPGVAFVSVDNRIALNSTRLPDPMHPDPADRMIVATARELGCPLVTADRKLIEYSHVDTIW